MKKIWLRLGGYIQVSNKEDLERILKGDSKTLVSVIKENGFTLNGETYIPQLGDIEQDIDFEIDSVELR